MAAEMHREGHGETFIADVVAFAGAHAVAVDQYLDDVISKDDEQPQALQGAAVVRAGQGLGNQPAMEFKEQQLVLYNAILKRVDLSMAAAAATDEAEGDALREKAHGRDHKPLVCSGPPGTGKTTVVHAAAREVLRRGGCVELTMPTGRMMTRVAEKLGVDEKLVVETCAAAFQLHKTEQEALFAMYGYDLVVVDEYSQLGMDDFERILRLWAAAGNLPALVFVGDKYQLPGVDPHRA